LCRSWRDAIAPSSIAGIGITKEKAGRGQPRLSVTSADVPALEICVNVVTADVPMQEVRDDLIARHPKALPRDDTALLSMGSRHFTDKNDPPNGASPCNGDRPTKRGEKRKSPSRGLGGMVIRSLPMPLPPTIRPMHSITPPLPLQFRSLPQEGIAGEEPRPLKMCCGVSVGNMGSSLTAAAAVYEHTARCLCDFASDPDFGMKRFAASVLAKSRTFFVQLHGMHLERPDYPGQGFCLRAVSCSGNCCSLRSSQCNECHSKKGISTSKISDTFKPTVEPAGTQAFIQKKFRNEQLAAIEIRLLRDEVRNLRRKLAQTILNDDMAANGEVLLGNESGERIGRAVGMMDSHIKKALVEKGDNESLELWQVHADHIVNARQNGGKGRGFKKLYYSSTILYWAMAFLARTSNTVYKEVAKVMMLPDISHIHRLTGKIVSTHSSKAFCLHIKTIQSLRERAICICEKWTPHQMIGVIAHASTNIKAGIEHNYVTNTLKEGDESHRLETCSHLFGLMAQRMKDSLLSSGPAASTEQPQHSSIFENIPLAKEHVVFKFSIMDPTVKCLEIVASVNVKKVTLTIISTILTSLRDVMSCYGFEIGAATCDAA
jgi:hypothetical protein